MKNIVWVLILVLFILSCSTKNNGKMVTSKDGVKVWYKISGPNSSIPTFYLHGGPGYNSYAFEKSVGKLLENKLKMVYVDQRGGGRSKVNSKNLLGIEQLREDIGNFSIS